MIRKVGFVGLGDQGKPIAFNLTAAGFDTMVYDLRPEPVNELVSSGAKAATSLAELATHSELIGICVPEDEHVRGVLLGENAILNHASPGCTIAIHSTVLPETIVELGTAATERGLHLLDACVTGGAIRAKQKQLTYLVGGESNALETARAYLETSAVHIVHAGELGNGARLKLCLNLITYIQWAAAFESFTLAKAIGLPQEILEEAGVSNGQITPLMQAYLGTHKAPAETRDSEAMQDLMRGYMQVAEKDLAWALKLARSAEVSLPVGSLVSQLMARLYGVNAEGKR